MKPGDERREGARIDERILRTLAGRIAHGDAVDWDVAATDNPQLRGVIEQLRRLQALGGACRRSDAEPAAERAAEAAKETAAGEAAESATETALGGATDRDDAATAAWGPLRIIERIGAGSFGEVFRAFDPVLQREVALKLANAGKDAGAGAFHSYLEEARRLASVRHPNVVAVYGVETHEGRPGVWTEFVRGEALERLLERDGPFPEERIVAVALDLVRALAAVHAAGLVHGDVKTQNTVREPDGRTVLLDFGSGSRRGGARRAFSGTPLAMAPELLRGGPPSPATDLYALGALLHRIATGRYPIEARTRRELLSGHRRGRRIPLAEARPDLPERLTAAIERLLAGDPRARPDGAAAFEAEVLAAAGGSGEAVAAGEATGTSGPARARIPGLPDPGTRFIGRRRELAAIRRALIDARLVTLAGIGGAGKTRLAARAAAELAAAYPEGAVWVSLVALRHPWQVEREIARALGLDEKIALTEGIGARPLLMVLDNCEHLRAACAELCAALLGSCPRLRILATSRRSLGVAGEQVVRIPPLELPASDEAGLAVTEAEAVRLFLDRAGRGLPAFRLDAGSAPSVARLCRRLGGIPLALELAAARVRTLGLAPVAARLEEDPGMLADREGRQAAHQRTLDGTIAWSTALLTEAEAALWRRLAIFRGGWTLEAAEAVCGGGLEDAGAADGSGGADGPEAGAVVHSEAGAPGLASIAGAGPGLLLGSVAAPEPGVPPASVADLLSVLVDSSLVQLETRPDGSIRYAMLEVVRTSARSRLVAAGEEPGLRVRHLSHFAAFAAEENRKLIGVDDEDSLRRLEADHENLRSALDWALRPRGRGAEANVARELASAFVLANALRRFWAVRGHAQEGLDRYQVLLNWPGAREDQRARTQVAAASLAWRLGDLARAEDFAQEAVRTRRDGPEEPLAGALMSLGAIATSRGDHARAQVCLEEAAVIVRRTGNRSALLTICINLGAALARSGALVSARERYEEALALAREIGDRASEGVVLANLGSTAADLGDIALGRELGEEGIAILRGLTNRAYLLAGLSTRTEIAQRAGDAVEIRTYALEALHVASELGDISVAALHLYTLLRLDLAQGRPERSARLFGAVEAICRARRVSFPPLGQERAEAVREGLEEALGSERLAVELAVGRGLSQEQAVAVAGDADIRQSGR